jgi:hypothetical protein
MLSPVFDPQTTRFMEGLKCLGMLSSMKIFGRLKRGWRWLQEAVRSC